MQCYQLGHFSSSFIIVPDSTKAVAAGTAVAPEVPEEHVHGGHHHEDKEEEVHQSDDEDVDKKDKPTQAVAAVLQQGPGNNIFTEIKGE